MFYSHNLLAKKGPLGTVWVAAHLQSKLKKSNYISVNIPSTVEQIMNPQVPIALRMSGHLLLGVVRIYSKKVEYLQHDCNVLRIDISKAYANADINLPEDANQARYESITLPDNFSLDLMDIDDHNLNGTPDRYLRLNEDISFTDYSPASFSKNRCEPPAGYIMISVGEETPRTPSILNLGPGSMHVDETYHPQTPPSTIHGVQDFDPNHNLGSNDISINEDNVTSQETLRINNSSLHKSPLVSLVLPDMVEPDPELVKEISELNNIDTSNLKEIPDNVGPSSPPMQVSPQDFLHSEHAYEPVLDNSGLQASIGLVPSPPMARRRRIKYDQATVLTNEVMRRAIDDAGGLKRKRKGLSSFLDVFRSKNAHKKQKVLFDPVITGLCDDLSQMHEDGNVSSKAHLINIEQASPDPMETERFSEFTDPIDNMIPISSPDNIQFLSPGTVDENTPAISTDIWSKSHQAETTAGTGVGPTPDPTSSLGSFMSDMETPVSESQHGFDNSGGLYDIPEVDAAEELAFMEDDDATPTLKGTPETGSLLPRTRCVAKLIKEKSAATPSTSENHGTVSMKSILEGKTRKICSRMFFETLVLKSCDFIDVKQNEPYGDIHLKVTQKLSKLDLSK